MGFDALCHLIVLVHMSSLFFISVEYFPFNDKRVVLLSIVFSLCDDKLNGVAG